jgi:hypothetical protein
MHGHNIVTNCAPVIFLDTAITTKQRNMSDVNKVYFIAPSPGTFLRTLHLLELCRNIASS